MKVIIIGGGLAGLTIAHELVKYNFNVTIFEKQNILGGMAKSIRVKNNIPTEHSWRGYGPFYYNTFNIMKQIPIKDNCITEKFNSNNNITLEEVKKHNNINSLWTIFRNNVYDITDYVNKHPGGKIILQAGGKDLEKVWKEMGLEWHLKNSNIINYLEKFKIGKLVNSSNDSSKEEFDTENDLSVYDNLGKKINFILLRNKLTQNNQRKIIDSIDYKDIPYLMCKIIEFESCSSERKKNFFKIPLKSIFPYISEKTIIYIRDFGSGPGLGLDWNKASLGHFLTVIGFGINKNAKWKVLNQPTNEGWIDIWEQYLKKKGEKIIKNHQLEFINIHNKNNTVKNLVIKNLNNNKIFNINGNYYIIASDPFSYQTILQKTLYNSKKNNINKKINIELTKLNKLNLINNQIGFVIGFNKKFNYKNNNDCFVLLDSPNNITFYPQDLHFCKNTNLGKNIKSLWSGTCVISYNKGLLYNKTLTELDLPKLKEEILSQLFSSNDLKWYISKNNKGHKLQKKDVEIIEIFNDWKYNKKNKKLVSNNPKWVNTFFNEQYITTYFFAWWNRPSGRKIKN